MTVLKETNYGDKDKKIMLDMQELIINSLRFEFRDMDHIIKRYDIDIFDFEDEDTEIWGYNLRDEIEDKMKEDYDLQEVIRDSITEVIYGDIDDVLANMVYLRDSNYDDAQIGEAFRNEEWGVLESMVREGLFYDNWIGSVGDFVTDLKDDLNDYITETVGNLGAEVDSDDEEYDEGFEESLKRKPYIIPANRKN